VQFGKKLYLANKTYSNLGQLHTNNSKKLKYINSFNCKRQSLLTEIPVTLTEIPVITCS